MEKKLWTSFQETKNVHIYTLINKNGTTIEVADLGCRILKIITKDKNGQLGDIVLGFNNLEDYEQNTKYFGSIIGRYANRISNGQFTLDGVTYTLEKNNINCEIGCNLHGGVEGFHKKLFNAKPLINEQTQEQGIEFTYFSKDGEEGFPGDLYLTSTYWLSNNDQLKIDYEAQVFKKSTIINLTNHSYFNFTQNCTGLVIDHELYINSDNITPIAKSLIPTGELMKVEGTAFDFRKPKKIGSDINSEEPQMQIPKGYDHNFVLNKTKENSLELAASVYEPTSGKTMNIYTTEPGIQLYTANYQKFQKPDKYGNFYEGRAAFCLETQHFPDSINNLGKFPNVILKPGQIFKSTTIYEFGIKK